MSHSGFSIQFFLEKEKFGIAELKKFKAALSKKINIPKEETLRFNYNKADFTITPYSTDFAYVVTIYFELHDDTDITQIEKMVKAVWESLAPAPMFCVGNVYDKLHPTITDASLKGTLPPIQEINILGDGYIKKIGEQNLLKTPAFKIEKVKNGILVLLSENLRDLSNKEKAEEYLRRFLK